MKRNKKRIILFLLLLIFAPFVIFGQELVNKIPWSFDIGNLIMVAVVGLSAVIWMKFQATRIDRNLPEIYQKIKEQDETIHSLEKEILTKFVSKEEFFREIELSKQLFQVQKTLDQILANAAQ